MDSEIIFPAPDPLPIPGPFWLFRALLWLMLFLHLLAMNGMLGGSILACIARIGAGKDPVRARIYRAGVKSIPAWVASTISLGVAALLFTQVLYGQAFYSATILNAWHWLGMLLFLLLAYYGFYLAAGRAAVSESPRGAVPLAPAVLFILGVGLMFSLIAVLMQRPETWLDLHLANRSGSGFNGADASLVPRYLHFVFASIAVAGLWMLISGFRIWREDRPQALRRFRFGGKAFIWATMVQFAVGVWFLLSLPEAQGLLFLGRDITMTVILFSGILAGVASLHLISVALRREDPRSKAKAAIAVGVLTVGLMAISRNLLRDAVLAPYLNETQVRTETQVSPLLVFLALLVIGVGTWIWMLHRYQAEAHGSHN